MASPSTLLPDNKKGFTLVEVLVVMAIFVFLISVGAVIGLDAFRGANYRSEINVMVSVLERARSRSMNNYYGVPNYGVSMSGFCYDNSDPLKPNYVLFRGPSYGASNVSTREAVAGNSAVTIYSPDPNLYCLPSNKGIIFTQLSGTTTQIDIGLTQDRRTSTTTINYEGAILW
jgi:prepilin-type N-terminal cleavage/methylation domain-containing protein